MHQKRAQFSLHARVTKKNHFSNSAFPQTVIDCAQPPEEGSMEEKESWGLVKDRRKIQEIFERLVSKNMELKILIDDENV